MKKKRGAKRHPRLDQDGFAHITIQGKDYKFNPLDVNLDELDKVMSETQAKFEELQKENHRWTEQANILFGHQQAGIELEKEGRLEAAIEEYEASVAYGREADKMRINQYYYSLERLCIIYRKLRLYDKEIATIEAALAEYINDKDRERMTARLDKAVSLKQKQR
ncbi:MAG: hypothetical protein MJY71_02630 [Bacteroidaceae bacterium]|nr:hypothetical protein [Bacteroidaceae bacterium]